MFLQNGDDPHQSTGTHAAADHQQVAQGGVQSQTAQAFLLVGGIFKALVHRDAQRVKSLLGDPPAGEGGAQVIRGDDISVALHLFGKGDAGVVGGNQQSGWQADAVVAHIGQDFTGEDVRHDNQIEVALFQKALHRKRHPMIDMVDR